MTPMNNRFNKFFGPVHEKGGHLFQRRGMVIRDLGPVSTYREDRTPVDQPNGIFDATRERIGFLRNG